MKEISESQFEAWDKAWPGAKSAEWTRRRAFMTRVALDAVTQHCQHVPPGVSAMLPDARDEEVAYQIANASILAKHRQAASVSVPSQNTVDVARRIKERHLKCFKGGFEYSDKDAASIIQAHTDAALSEARAEIENVTAALKSARGTLNYIAVQAKAAHPGFAQVARMNTETALKKVDAVLATVQGGQAKSGEVGNG